MIEGVNAMERRKFLFLFLLVCISFTFIPSTAFADLSDIDPYTEIFHQDLKQEYGNQQPIFMQYSPISYRLDYANSDQGGASSGTFLLINTILSFCMVGMALAAKLTIDIMTWAFNYHQISFLTDNIQSIVDQLVDKLFFTELFFIGIFALGVSLIFTFYKKEDVAGKLFKVIINLVIAFTLLTNMNLVIEFLNGLSERGSDIVFIAFEQVAGGETEQFNEDDKGKNAFLNVAGRFFEYNVHIPWQLGEFGDYVPLDKTNLTSDEELLKQEVDKTLSMPVQEENDDESTSGLTPAKFTSRFDEQDQQDKNNSIAMSSFGIPFRIFIVWFTFTVGTLYGCLLLAIAGTAIVCQFLMYLLAIIAPLVFILVLIPEWGDQMLIRWLQGIVVSAVYKVIASLVLIMILFLQDKVYDVSGSWAYAMFAQMVIVFAVFLFRRNLIEYIPLPGVAAFQYAENRFDKGKSLVDKTLDSVVDRARSAAVVGGVMTGAPTENRGVVANVTRDAIRDTEERENLRKGLFAQLNETVNSQSKSSSQSEQKSSSEESRSPLRRQANKDQEYESTLNDSAPKTVGSRNAVTGQDGLVHVVDVKEAIDRLAEKQRKSDEDFDEEVMLRGNSLRDQKDPVDVRVVDFKPSKSEIDEMTKETAAKPSRRSVDQNETIEVKKRTVTPIVKKEKVEEVKKTTTRKIPKLDFPEIDSEKEAKDSKKEQDHPSEEIDPKQMLEQQALGPELMDKEEKPDQKKKGWLKKWTAKFKKT